MPAPVKQLVKVGFNPRQAAMLQRLATGPLPSETELVRHVKFTRQQARVLRTAQPAVGGATPTPYVPPDFVRLVREAKFTRHQANLVRQA